MDIYIEQYGMIFFQFLQSAFSMFQYLQLQDFTFVIKFVIIVYKNVYIQQRKSGSTFWYAYTRIIVRNEFNHST